MERDVDESVFDFAWAAPASPAMERLFAKAWDDAEQAAAAEMLCDLKSESSEEGSHKYEPQEEAELLGNSFNIVKLLSGGLQAKQEALHDEGRVAPPHVVAVLQQPIDPATQQSVIPRRQDSAMDSTSLAVDALITPRRPGPDQIVMDSAPLAVDALITPRRPGPDPDQSAMEHAPSAVEALVTPPRLTPVQSTMNPAPFSIESGTIEQGTNLFFKLVVMDEICRLAQILGVQQPQQANWCTETFERVWKPISAQLKTIRHDPRSAIRTRIYALTHQTMPIPDVPAERILPPIPMVVARKDITVSMWDSILAKQRTADGVTVTMNIPDDVQRAKQVSGSRSVTPEPYTYGMIHSRRCRYTRSPIPADSQYALVQTRKARMATLNTQIMLMRETLKYKERELEELKKELA